MPDRVLTAYRERVARVRAQVERQLLARYGAVDPDAISASFETYIAAIAPVIEAGQRSASDLAAGFLRSRVLAQRGELVDLEDAGDIPGTTRDGKPLPAGLAAIPALVLSQIGKGGVVDAALEYGRYLVTRTADNEITGAIDRTFDRNAPRTHVVGWEGIVAADACDPCTANAGVHDLETEFYRHPGCHCERIPILG